MSQVISLINEKGGVGKSTSSITISQILAISGYKVLTIDLDPQMNTSKVFGARKIMILITNLYSVKNYQKKKV